MKMFILSAIAILGLAIVPNFATSSTPTVASAPSMLPMPTCDPRNPTCKIGNGCHGGPCW